MAEKALSHLNDQGSARMVDVGGKLTTRRTACAEAAVRLGSGLAGRIAAVGGVEKGSVIETARLAGIMAAKQTSALIPLCHQIPLDHVEVEMELDGDLLLIRSRVDCSFTTGVEMEALTAVSVAALTVYDMCKAAEKGIIIERIRLVNKTGGKSGDWHAGEGTVL